MVLFLLQALAKTLSRAWEAASPSDLRGPAPAAGDVAGRSRCDTERAYQIAREARYDAAARGGRSSRQNRYSVILSGSIERPGVATARGGRPRRRGTTLNCWP